MVGGCRCCCCCRDSTAIVTSPGPSHTHFPDRLLHRRVYGKHWKRETEPMEDKNVPSSCARTTLYQSRGARRSHPFSAVVYTLQHSPRKFLSSDITARPQERLENESSECKIFRGPGISSASPPFSPAVLSDASFHRRAIFSLIARDDRRPPS